MPSAPVSTIDPLPADMQELIRKVDLILNAETALANAVGAEVIDKPRVSYWMILVPILFLHFIYQMQKYKRGRQKFTTDFMITRRRALQVAYDATKAATKPEIDPVVRQSDLSEDLQVPYARWVEALVAQDMELLSAKGDRFERLVRSAFRDQTTYLLSLNRLNGVEEAFYAALKPHMAGTEGAAEIIAKIETATRRLRREAAQRIFA